MMTKSWNRVRLIAAFFCLMLAACVSSRPIKFYRIEIPAPVSTAPASDAPSDVTLQVGNIDSPPIMRDGRILYAVGAHEMGTYEYHRWVETPDRIVQDSLLRLLRASGRYSSVDGQRSNVKADYVVQGKIYEFSEVDAQDIRTRVSLEIELRDSKSGRTVWSRTYTHDEPVEGKEMPDVVDSLDRNLRQGLSEIVSGIDRYFTEHQAGGLLDQSYVKRSAAGWLVDRN
jgi:ABC-type uncharacterized transport system auxiliary subunit